MSPRCELVLPGNVRVSNGTRCHKNVIPMVVNGGKMRTKGEQRRRKGFIRFSRNLQISFDYGQLRQVLIKLVVRLLTEMLEVRILPGEPTPFSFNEL